MSFFSRTSDIISRNLSDLLANEPDKVRAIQQIVLEMEQGLAGVRRSAQTAEGNQQRIAGELIEHRGQVTFWASRAREELSAGREDEARAALLRKKELEDLIGGLQQEHTVAKATRDQLQTTLRAVEARLAEARRMQTLLLEGTPTAAVASVAAAKPAQMQADSWEKARVTQVEDELEALKREMRLL